MKGLRYVEQVQFGSGSAPCRFKEEAEREAHLSKVAKSGGEHTILCDDALKAPMVRRTTMCRVSARD